MASRTLDVATLYVDGTVLNAYQFGVYVDNPDGTPPPTATASGTVTSGSVTFSGLADGTKYYAGLGTDPWRYFGFSTPAVSTSGGSGGLTPTAVKTANYTAAVGELVLCDTTGGSFTVTAPAAGAGSFGVKHVIQGSLNSVTIAAAGGDVFNRAGGPTTLNLPLVDMAKRFSGKTGQWAADSGDMTLASIDARYAPKLATPPAWAASTAYNAGDVAMQRGVQITRITTGTSRAVFDGTETLQWAALDGKLAPYLGPVSGRGRIPVPSTISSNTYKQYMTWRVYRAQEDMPATALEYPGFAGTGEATATATGTVECSVEYPIGTITRVTFNSGQTQGTIPAGGLVRSDLTTLTTKIPAGALYWIGTWVNWDANTQVPRFQDGLQYLTALSTSLREAASASSTTIANTVMSGSRTLGGSISSKTGDSYGPCAILGMTRRPTVFLAGDSETQGQFVPVTSEQDAGLVQGILENIVGNRIGYINGGTQSDSYLLTNVTGAYTNRLALSHHCTDIIDGYGVNDSYVTANATWVANAKTFRLKFSQLKTYIKTTVIPKVNGAWNLADGSDQSPAGNTINYNANNASIRGLLDGTIDNYIDLEDITSLGRGTGLAKPAERVVTDGAITAGSNVLTSATAKFNAGDVGKYVGIAGAGASGANSTALIKTITNATTVVVSTGDDSTYSATTTVSGAVVGIGLSTSDGTHQTTVRAKAISDAQGPQRVIAPLLARVGAVAA